MPRHRLTVAEQIAGLTSLEVFNGMRRVHTMAAYRLREMRARTFYNSRVAIDILERNMRELDHG